MYWGFIPFYGQVILHRVESYSGDGHLDSLEFGGIMQLEH